MYVQSRWSKSMSLDGAERHSKKPVTISVNVSKEIVIEWVLYDIDFLDIDFRLTHKIVLPSGDLQILFCFHSCFSIDIPFFFLICNFIFLFKFVFKA